jgi:hypothetical protein
MPVDVPPDAQPVGAQLALELLSAPYSRKAQAGEKAQAEKERQEYILKEVMVRWNTFHANPPRCINERQLRGGVRDHRQRT